MNKKNIWSLLKKELLDFPHSKCSNATEQQIYFVEKTIKININLSFKEFLKNYECAIIDEYRIFTINKNDFFSSKSNLWSLINANDFYKKESEWPDIDDWLIISDDGSGNPIGILPNGEVWISDYYKDYKQFKLANNFEEFVYKLLMENINYN